MVYTEASTVGPVLRRSGMGARCVRKSSCVRGSPPKTEDGGWCHAVPMLEGGMSPPKPTPGMGQDGEV